MSVYGVFAGAIGTRRGDANLVASARLSAVAVALALTVAMALLELALLTDDFSVGYVANTSSTSSPAWVKVVTLWAALDGSILLWAWTLSLYTAALALFAPNTALRPLGARRDASRTDFLRRCGRVRGRTPSPSCPSRRWTVQDPTPSYKTTG